MTSKDSLFSDLSSFGARKPSSLSRAILPHILAFLIRSVVQLLFNWNVGRSSTKLQAFIEALNVNIS